MTNIILSNYVNRRAYNVLCEDDRSRGKFFREKGYKRGKWKFPGQDVEVES